MEALLYGDNGLTGKASALANQPAINPRMRQGLDAMANYYQSPLYQSIFNQILGQGQSLMGQGVAPNPYQQTGLRRNPMGRSGSMGFGYQPNYTQQPQTQQTAQALPQQMATQGNPKDTQDWIALQDLIRQQNMGA